MTPAPIGDPGIVVPVHGRVVRPWTGQPRGPRGGGGALAHATADAVTYLLLAAICALTLARLWASRRKEG